MAQIIFKVIQGHRRSHHFDEQHTIYDFCAYMYIAWFTMRSELLAEKLRIFIGPPLPEINSRITVNFELSSFRFGRNVKESLPITGLFQI